MADTTLPVTPPQRRVRRLWIPALFLLFPVVIRVLQEMAKDGRFGEGAIFNLMQVFTMAVMLAILGIGLWFFFLSGLAPRLRIGAAVVLAGLAIAFFAAVDRVEFDGQMSPRAYWKWEPTPEKRLADHLATATKAAGTADLTIGRTDSPAFRGRLGTGEAIGVRLDADWTATPPMVLWKQPCGGGHSGFAVAGNSAITIEQIGNEEVVACYDRATGQVRWKHAYASKFAQSEPMGGNGPRATPTIADGDVYSLGATGELLCLRGTDGQPKWRVNILDDNDADNVDWGMTGSPLVFERLVVVNPGAKAGTSSGQSALAAYDRTTGKKVWTAPGGRAGYASPNKATLAGQEQLIVFDAAGLAGHEPAAGTRLWFVPWKTPMDMNSAQPLVVGPNRVMVSSEQDNGAAVYEITRSSDGWPVTQVWKTRKYAARYACPVLHNGHIYGLTGGSLICLDATTGDVKWKDGTYGNGQLVLAGDRLVVTNERGKVHLVAADPGEFRELGSISVLSDRTWNMPAVAGNQIFIRNHREMACLELPAAK